MGGVAVDHAGKTFGFWTVKERAKSTTKGGAAWLCVCVCGGEKVVPAESLVRGKSKSCGCKSDEMRSVNNTKHGHTRFDGYTSGTYRSWHAMRQRCTRVKHKQYADYGGRGISVCERWSSFENFLADMGERPDGMTLDRWPDTNGNYEPGNCRWATNSQQSLNQRPKIKNKDTVPLIAAIEGVLAADNDNLAGAIETLGAVLDAFKRRA